MRECHPGQTYHLEEIDFKDYVKGVLPNEWLPHWEQESLRAGAIVVKNYAASMYNARGYVWDCTWNQVYDPTRRTEQTDKAVDDTWATWLWHDGDLARTYFNANKAGCATQDPDNCISQYETQRLARQGYFLRFIILRNYEGILITLYN